MVYDFQYFKGGRRTSQCRPLARQLMKLPLGGAFILEMRMSRKYLQNEENSMIDWNPTENCIFHRELRRITPNYGLVGLWRVLRSSFCGSVSRHSQLHRAS